MPNYMYIAKSLKGESHSGDLEAKDKKYLARALKKKGYILVSAQTTDKKKKSIFNTSIPFLDKVKLTEKMLFTRNLQVMVSAGVPLPRALQTLSSIVKSQKFKKVLLEIKEDVLKGNNFSSAVSKHPEVFSELFSNMLKVGEESGTLDEVLGVLSEQMAKEHELRSKIIGAIIYPTIIILTMIGIGIMMLVLVVPTLAATFEDLGVELPITTKIIIFTGIFLVEKWYIMILALPIVFFLFLKIVRTKKGSRAVDKILLKIPVISTLIKQINAAYTSRTLGSLIKAGVPIVNSLNILSNTLGNYYYKKAMKDAAAQVKAGRKLSEALEPYSDIYPIIVIQMLRVGEETGETSNILTKLAEFFEQEVTQATENLSAVIEPVLMLIVGGAVGFFAISMIQPMYSMLQAI